MNRETAKRNLAIVEKQISLLESCIEHATSNRNAFDTRSTLLETYSSALDELRREIWDYREISRPRS